MAVKHEHILLIWMCYTLRHEKATLSTGERSTDFAVAMEGRVRRGKIRANTTNPRSVSR
jgi:hypothetical protein